MKNINWLKSTLSLVIDHIRLLLSISVHFGRHLKNVPENAIVFFPCMPTTLCCGLSGIIAVKRPKTRPAEIRPEGFETALEKMVDSGIAQCNRTNLGFDDHYLGGGALITALLQSAQRLKEEDHFLKLYSDPELKNRFIGISEQLKEVIGNETQYLADHIGHLPKASVEIISRRIEDLKDIQWCLSMEVARNLSNVADLLSNAETAVPPEAVAIYKKINSVLNSIDRLEVRGRDSAGMSLLFILKKADYERFIATLDASGHLKAFKSRSSASVLVNGSISIHESPSQGTTAVAVTYKVAAEIGKLGDNIRYLREQITNDPILHHLTVIPNQYHTVSSHTRWASVGAITVPNCHPVDNATTGKNPARKGIIHVCLNGDIDNYLALRKALETAQDGIPEEITTDTKIIPLCIEKYLGEGKSIEEAFRLALNDFEGSHAIGMHTDLAPGKFFLAQRGSGQAMFVGVADSHYMPASEVYGFVEETPYYIKMEGEAIVQGKNGQTQGQIFILNQESGGGLEGISAMYYDGAPITLIAENLKSTEITSRDIDRQNFPHYFLKEISESPVSVEKTLQNRWKIKQGDTPRYIVALKESTFPVSLEKALKENRIKRVFFVGQGTAGVAAQTCADILNYYLNEPALPVNALKSSELSGFRLSETDAPDSMADALVVAISQSGTTTDTNRTVDMVKERGAHTLAIVNRRDSDITFKVDGVFYTSSGRDIEMSVASTKAFYSQIIAGAVLGLKIAELKGKRNPAFISEEIKRLIEIPALMVKVLEMKAQMEASARRLAPTKTYWAAVGSGPNKASADEIRIKLSELCYKTISSDYVEDKKHIDLSSEPLIIVCAAGSKGTVIGDIIKDTAIFKAHKATPVVIADEGEERFTPYAEDVFHVPMVNAHLAPILNTLVGHLWGYYAALAINEGSRFLHDFREDTRKHVDKLSSGGMDIYEVILEASFREKIALFYTQFRKKNAEKQLPAALGRTSDLTLLLKYLSGRLPVSDFEMDFGKKGTALNMLDTLFTFLGEAINQMSRPVDAIKHQAKTVTVGTSRISEKLEGILFETLSSFDLSPVQLINRNILVMKNLQEIISEIKGAILYKIDGLNLLGEPTEKTTIHVMRKEGVLKPIPSRVETDNDLKGTKRIIVRQGNVYIGKGRKDDRSILIIPLISTDPAAPNRIEHLLLLNIAFKETVPLPAKIKALGGKYEHIKNIVQENSIPWEDEYLNRVEMEELFGRSAEKIGESIITGLDR